MARFSGFDGAELAVVELGEGRPILLLHGLFSSGEMNWRRYGAAAEIASAGYRVIMPDFRAHGQSAAPHDPAAYPPDVLAMDIEALIAQLGLSDFDVAGYSMGARTLARLLARGLKPGRAILAGMGLEGLTGGAARAAHFQAILAQPDGWPAGSPEAHAAAFIRQNNIDRLAVSLLIGSQTSTPIDVLRGFETRILVLCGRNDSDNGSAPALALELPNAALVEIAGNHMSAVTKPDFGTAIAAWLGHPL
ncbi:alpha/beta hydrolase [Sandarakinorhabdus sp. AAP62]|uniref:alpha/beta fold hydrolase n=1 Tax=Sandarakinorhabdus sp. AAP62 TaxID=1248916 RepID=UPI0002EFCC82|nr:alpha/beta hydrolase [Sandarakinorhabdus sp. AAP62]